MPDVGVTATREGLTGPQCTAAAKLLIFCQVNGVTTLHHGDCIGGDETLHGLAREAGMRVVLHPPIDDSRRAHCEADESREPQPFLVRNQHIVDEAQFALIACPQQETEQLRSGTWATIRYARLVGRTIFLVTPDGRITEEAPNAAA